MFAVYISVDTRQVKKMASHVEKNITLPVVTREISNARAASVTTQIFQSALTSLEACIYRGGYEDASSVNNFQFATAVVHP